MFSQLDIFHVSGLNEYSKCFRPPSSTCLKDSVSCWIWVRTGLRKCSALLIPNEAVGWYYKCLQHILARHAAYKWDSRLWAPYRARIQHKHETALLSITDLTYKCLLNSLSFHLTLVLYFKGKMAHEKWFISIMNMKEQRLCWGNFNFIQSETKILFIFLLFYVYWHNIIFLLFNRLIYNILEGICDGL